jgi:hypothetical protein
MGDITCRESSLDLERDCHVTGDPHYPEERNL